MSEQSEREALRQLVALKDMKDRLKNLQEMGHGADYDDYYRLKPLAWAAARAALATPAPVAGAGELPELPEPRPIPGFYEIEQRISVRYDANQMHSYARLAVAQALKQQGAAQWVSVKDRLPDIPQNLIVLVWTWDGRFVWNSEFGAAGFVRLGVTHWMPRPTPAPPEAQP